MLDTLAVLKALGDETRIRILNLLYDGELCVCDIMEVLQITQTKASRHLGVMKNAGLVRDRKQAQWSHYALVRHEDDGFIDLLVRENLRKDPLYAEDLERCAEWVRLKNTQCSQCG